MNAKDPTSKLWIVPKGLLKGILFVYQVAMIGLLVITVTLVSKFIQLLVLTSGWTSLVAGVLNLVVGIAMNRRLKSYFEEFYQENKCTLWTSTIGLSLPLLFRASLNLMRAYHVHIIE